MAWYASGMDDVMVFDYLDEKAVRMNLDFAKGKSGKEFFDISLPLIGTVGPSPERALHSLRLLYLSWIYLK